MAKPKDKPENVYVVAAGYYDNYRVVACFTSRYRAKNFIGRFPDPGSYRIEAYPLNADFEWGYQTVVTMESDGRVRGCRTIYERFPKTGYRLHEQYGRRVQHEGQIFKYYVLCATFLTDNHKQAVKAANDLRRELLKSGEWAE